MNCPDHKKWRLNIYKFNELFETNLTAGLHHVDFLDTEGPAWKLAGELDPFLSVFLDDIEERLVRITGD